MHPPELNVPPECEREREMNSNQGETHVQHFGRSYKVYEGGGSFIRRGNFDLGTWIRLEFIDLVKKHYAC